MFFHSTLRFIKTIFDLMPNVSESFDIGRIEPEEVRIRRSLDDQRVFKINYRPSRFLNSSRLKDSMTSSHGNFLSTMEINSNQALILASHNSELIPSLSANERCSQAAS